MTTHTYDHNNDGLPVLTKPTGGGDDIGGLPVFKPAPVDESVKKKEAQTYLAAGLQKVASIVGWDNSSTDGKTKPVSETDKIKQFVTGEISTPHNTELVIPKPITEKPIKKRKEILTIGQEVENVSKNHLNEIMYGEGNDWKDPIKALNKKEKNAKTLDEAFSIQHAKDLTEQSLAPTGYDAKKVLQNSHWGNADNENLTAQILKSKAKEYDNDVSPLREITPETNIAWDWNIRNAAIKAQANKDQGFKNQLESSGIDLNDPQLFMKVGPEKSGQLLDQYLQNGNVKTFLEKENSNHELSKSFKYADENLLKQSGQYGISKVANAISRELQKSGYNSIDPIFNPDTQQARDIADQTAKQLFRDDPKSLEYYEAHKDEVMSSLDRPSLFEGVAGGIKNVFGGMGNLNALWQSRSKDIQDEWTKEATNVSADPEGLVKHLRNAGNAAGFVMGLAAGGEVLQGANAGVTPGTAQKAMIGMSVFGDALKEGEMKYKNPVKAWTNAGISTIGMMAMSDIFPSAKLGKVFNEAKPELNSIAESLSSGAITKEAAREQMATTMSKAIDWGKKAFKQNLTASAEWTALTGVKQGMDKLMGLDQESYDKYHPTDLADTFGSFFLSNALVSGFVAAGESKSREMENKIYEAANYPKRYEEVIDAQKLKDPSIDADQMKENLKFITEVKSKLDADGIDPINQKRFLTEALKEKVNKENIASRPESNITRRTQQQIRGSQEVQDKILNGEDVAGDEERATMPKEEVDIISRVNKVGKGGIINIMKVAGSETEKLNFLKEQSLGTPHALKQQLGDDENLVTDIIASNSKPEIKNSIDRFTAELKNTEDRDRFDEIEAHIDLLEKGLEKAKDKPVIRVSASELEAAQPKQNENTSKATEASPESNEPPKAEQPGEATLSIEGEQNPPEPPVETKPIEAGEEGNKVGVRHESLKKIADRLGLEQPERGTFLSPEDQTKRGRLLLQGGADPIKIADDFKKDGKVNADEISVVRAHFENLVKEADAALGKYGKGSPEFAKTKLEVDKWEKEVMKPMGTASGGAFSALQGETDLDTGSFISMQKAVEKETDKPINKEQEKKIDQLTAQVKELQKKADESEAALIKYTDENIGNKKTKKTHEEYVKERKDSFQAARNALKQLRSGQDGLGVSVPLVRELSAVAPHISKIVRSLIDEGVDKLGDIVDTIHDELSKDMIGLRRRDVLDLVAGDYHKQKDQSPELNKYADIKKQSKLLKKLEDLQQGLPEDFDSNKPEQSPEVKELVEKIKKVKKDLADMGYMKEKTDFEKEPLTPEEKSINRLQKELDDLQQGIAKQKNTPRERSDKEKELQEKINEERTKMGLTPSKEEKPLTEKEQKDAAEEELKSIQAKFVDKKDNKFSIDEAKDIWDYAKKNYLDKGTSWADMIRNASDDLGLTWRQVNDAVTSPKTKPISDQMWKKRSDLLRAKSAAKNWVDTQNEHAGIKALKKVSGAFRGLAVFGHGGIFVGTHAGMTFFQPTTWKYTIPAFFRGWKYAYGNKANYERSMEELKSRGNYLLAQRAGLKNNPDRINTEEFQKSQKFLGKLGGAGERGFNAIKILRQDLFDHEYSKLSDREKADPNSAVRVARLMNNATGATNLKIPEWVNEASFAGGMEASRWGKLTRNPVEATAIGIKALLAPDKATVEERVFAKVWAKRVGEQLATFTAAMIANAAIQNTMYPNNPTNYTNPNKPDFMKFKFGDMTIDPTSGMRGAMMFIYGLGKIPFESRKERKGDTVIKSEGKQAIGYLRGKAAPLYSTILDFFTHQDYNNNQMPFSNETPSAGTHKLSWLEYAWSKAPLPMAEAAHVTYQSAIDNGADKVTLNSFLHGIVSGVLSGSTGFRVGEYDAEKQNHSPFTEQDNKNPSFKYFIDKGLELPNTVHTSEEITDERAKTKKKLSDYPKDVQDKYDEVHKEILSQELKHILANGHVFVKEYKDAKGEQKNQVSLTHQIYSKRRKISDLNNEELAQVLRLSQSEATKKAKKKIFKTH